MFEVKISNIDELNLYLKQFVPPARSFRGVYSLDRMRSMMKSLDNSQDSYKVIHVAGTSGKTSTAYYVANMLNLTGKKTGLTVSPHIGTINERIQINMAPLSEIKFCKYFDDFISTGITEFKPTYFEILVAFAFFVFAKEDVEYAVVEVGLGGLLDGTNVITRLDKISVITDIGLDHTEVLGKKIADIATQKASIILKGSDACMLDQSDEVTAVIKHVARSADAKLHIGKLSKAASDLTSFQARNWSLAYSVLKLISARDHIKLTENFMSDSKRVYIPGRMEEIDLKGRALILDGSHNSQKIHALTEAISDKYKGQRVTALVSFVEGKQDTLLDSMKELEKITDKLYVTTFDIGQDLHRKSIKPEYIADKAKQAGFSDIVVCENPEQAFRSLMNEQSDVLLVTGSFYLLNHIRPLIKEQK